MNNLCGAYANPKEVRSIFVAITTQIFRTKLRCPAQPFMLGIAARSHARISQLPLDSFPECLRYSVTALQPD